MRYAIAHMIEEPVASRHKAIVDSIVQKFNVHDVSTIVPAHITLKAPFEANAEQIQELEVVLRVFARLSNISHIRLQDFSHFGREVVYVDVMPSYQASLLVRALMGALQTLPWLTFAPYDISPELHATVAMKDISEKFDEVLQFLSTLSFSADINFNSISLLEYEDDKWKVVARYPFSS